MRSRILPTLLLAIWLIVPPGLNAGNGSTKAARVHPNPFTEGTTFQLSMPKAGNIQIAVYDITGNLIRTLFDGMHDKGEYDIYWDGKDWKGTPVVAGTYICTLFADGKAISNVKVVKAYT